MWAKQRQTALEYQKDEKRQRYVAELRAQRERDVQDATTYQTDIKNACPNCRLIRSAWEIRKGTCNNCD